MFFFFFFNKLNSIQHLMSLHVCWIVIIIKVFFKIMKSNQFFKDWTTTHFDAIYFSQGFGSTLKSLLMFYWEECRLRTAIFCSWTWFLFILLQWSLILLSSWKISEITKIIKKKAISSWAIFTSMLQTKIITDKRAWFCHYSNSDRIFLETNHCYIQTRVRKRTWKW